MGQERLKGLLLRLKKLPLTLGEIGFEVGNCIEEDVGQVHLIASKEQFPIWIFRFSLSGPEEEREKIIRKLEKLLGMPFDYHPDPINPRIWHYFWKDSDKTLQTEVRTLSRKRIEEIWQEFSLTKEDEKIIDEILGIFSTIFEKLMKQVMERLTSLIDGLKDMSELKKRAILSCVLKRITDLACTTPNHSIH